LSTIVVIVVSSKCDGYQTKSRAWVVCTQARRRCPARSLWRIRLVWRAASPDWAGTV